MSVLNHCQQRLQQFQPAHILIASATPQAEIREYCKQHQCSIDEVTPTTLASNHPAQAAQQAKKQSAQQSTERSTELATPPSFGIIIDFLEHLAKPVAKQCLSQWRNRNGMHLWLAIDANHSEWQLQDFIALGFQRQAQFPDKTIYEYDIANYNQRRAWNNPRYWANPEMWDKR